MVINKISYTDYHLLVDAFGCYKMPLSQLLLLFLLYFITSH